MTETVSRSNILRMRRISPCRVLAALFAGATLAASPAYAKKPHAAHKHRVPTSPQPDMGITSTWHQDPALRQQLASESHIEGFALRPPQGYMLGQHDENRQTDNVFLFIWTGLARTDGSAPELHVQLTKLKPRVVELQTLDDRLDVLLGSMKQGAPWLVFSPFQHGLVNDVPFVRVYYKTGPDAPEGHPITHGFIYKATSNDAKWLITIIGRDVEPYNDQTVPLLEASTLTFHKQ